MAALSKNKNNEIKKNEHEGHRKRLKKRALLEGLDHFEDHVLLELLLFYTIPRADTNETAHKLMNQFGSLAGVMDASVASLEQVKGIGYESALFLHLIPQVCRRYIKSRNAKGIDVSSPESVLDYLSAVYLGKNNEAVYIISTDKRRIAKNCVCISEGSENQANVNIGHIIQELTAVNAEQVIIAHNHPNGPAQPSDADIQLTKNLSEALRPLRITLLDHMIFSPGSIISLNKMPNCSNYFIYRQ